MTKDQKLQAFMRHYRDVTGESDLDMHKVANLAVRQGWRLPKPIDPLDMLAKEFSHAAREEIRHDQQTGKPYRANHAYPVQRGNMTMWLWIDVDIDAPRPKMLKSLMKRRDQMVGDGLMLSYDADHWNATHPADEPIQIPLDFTDDVEWRKNAPDDEEEAVS